jgi:hypothetical protein
MQQSSFDIFANQPPHADLSRLLLGVLYDSSCDTPTPHATSIPHATPVPDYSCPQAALCCNNHIS